MDSKKLVLVRKAASDPYKVYEVFKVDNTGRRRYLGRIARYEDKRWYTARGINGRYREVPSFRRPSEAADALTR